MDAVQAQLEKLKKKYGLGLPDKISQIEASLATLMAGPWEEQVSTTAYRQVHSLAGSSGTYGYMEISTLARAAEAILKRSLESRASLPEDQKSQVAGLMAKIRDLAAAAARESSL